MEVVLGITFLNRAVGFYVDGEWVCQTNGVRDLNKASMGQTGGDERLSNISCIVCARSIDLARIFTRESATTMRGPSTIGVDNNLTPG